MGTTVDSIVVAICSLSIVLYCIIAATIALHRHSQWIAPTIVPLSMVFIFGCMLGQVGIIVNALDAMPCWLYLWLTAFFFANTIATTLSKLWQNYAAGMYQIQFKAHEAWNDLIVSEGIDLGDFGPKRKLHNILIGNGLPINNLRNSYIDNKKITKFTPGWYLVHYKYTTGKFAAYRLYPVILAAQICFPLIAQFVEPIYYDTPSVVCTHDIYTSVEISLLVIMLAVGCICAIVLLYLTRHMDDPARLHTQGVLMGIILIVTLALACIFAVLEIDAEFNTKHVVLPYHLAAASGITILVVSSNIIPLYLQITHGGSTQTSGNKGTLTDLPCVVDVSHVTSDLTWAIKGNHMDPMLKSMMSYYNMAKFYDYTIYNVKPHSYEFTIIHFCFEYIKHLHHSDKLDNELEMVLHNMRYNTSDVSKHTLTPADTLESQMIFISTEFFNDDDNSGNLHLNDDSFAMLQHKFGDSVIALLELWGEKAEGEMALEDNDTRMQPAIYCREIFKLCWEDPIVLSLYQRFSRTYWYKPIDQMISLHQSEV